MHERPGNGREDELAAARGYRNRILCCRTCVMRERLPSERQLARLSLCRARAGASCPTLYRFLSRGRRCLAPNSWACAALRCGGACLG